MPSAVGFEIIEKEMEGSVDLGRGMEARGEIPVMTAGMLLPVHTVSQDLLLQSKIKTGRAQKTTIDSLEWLFRQFLRVQFHRCCRAMVRAKREAFNSCLQPG